jgi:hypothetical protein
MPRLRRFGLPSPSPNGTLTLASNAGLTFLAGDGNADATMTFEGTLTAINNALNGLEYMPNPDFSGTETLIITVNDLGHNGPGGPQTTTATITINVTPVNDAPVLDASGNPFLDDIREDDVANSGTLISDLLARTAGVTDVDGPGAGIALIDVDTTNGTWEYSLDDGVTWIPVIGVSFTNALLLPSTARLRFIPLPDFKRLDAQRDHFPRLGSILRHRRQHSGFDRITWRQQCLQRELGNGESDCPACQRRSHGVECYHELDESPHRRQFPTLSGNYADEFATRRRVR